VWTVPDGPAASTGPRGNQSRKLQIPGCTYTKTDPKDSATSADPKDSVSASNSLGEVQIPGCTYTKTNPKDSATSADPKDSVSAGNSLGKVQIPGCTYTKTNPKDSATSADPNDSVSTTEQPTTTASSNVMVPTSRAGPDQSTGPNLAPASGAGQHCNGSRFTVNLSQIHLDPAELELLNRGLTFVPTYVTLPQHTVYSLQNRLIRNLKLKDYFKEKDGEVDFDFSKKTFTHPSRWTPADGKISQPTLQTIQCIVSATEVLISSRPHTNGDMIRLRGSKNNLSAPERDALVRLQNNPAIVIKPADKGSATVILDKSAYLAEGYRQLLNTKYYRRLPAPLYPANVPRINSILEDMYADRSISEAQLRYLKASESDRARRFYMLPKIHKPRSKWPQPDRMPEGRPIVSDSGSESYRVAELIDSFLKPLSTRHQSYLKDTYHFVDKIRHQRIPKDAYLVTGDVTALYTNMTHERMLRVVQQAFRRYPSSTGRPDKHLLQLLDLTLRSNDFQFNGETYLQICGTAMGKVYAPSLADLYLEEFDEAANGYLIALLLYSRFLDDIFFVWTGTEDELRDFGVYLNSILEGITITLNYSRESVDFLDTTVYKSSLPDDTTDTVELLTKVYFKETDTHQLLHKQSFHPRHTCRGVLKSQMLRFKRISSSKTDFDEACMVLFRALAERNYSRRLMRTVKMEVWLSPTATANQDSRPILPIIVPFNDFGCRLAHQWREAINSNAFFATSFKLITAYTIGSNLRRKLVHSLLTVPPKRRSQPISQGQPGCRPCASIRCHAANHIGDSNYFTSCVNGQRFKVRGSINCHTSNLIYLITCSKCNLQYVGETSRPMADRLNDHLSSVRLQKPTPIGLHFNLPHHQPSDLLLMGIERFDDKTRPEIRKTKEIAWQNLLQTAHPLGLNNLKPSDLTE
jgi:hypothetical protein